MHDVKYFGFASTCFLTKTLISILIHDQFSDNILSYTVTYTHTHTH